MRNEKRKRMIVASLMIFVAIFTYCCSLYRDGWECKKFLWRMKLEEPDCLKLKSVGLGHESQDFFIWYDVYYIWIQFTHLGDAISFCNTATDYMVEKTGGPKFGGHHLFEVVISVDYNLSELSVLENVKYLTLQYGTVTDDIYSLKNMRELIYISIMGKSYKVTPDKTFTEEEQQAIKKMYPDCYISCYPVDTD